MNTRKIALAGCAVAVLALAGGYFASPLIAAHTLRAAAMAGDADKLQRMVDFPSVRESLKGQLNVLLLAEMQKDPELANNPFAGLAVAMVPSIVNHAIEGYVAPDGISAMMSAQAPTSAAPAATDAVNPGGGGRLASREPVVSHGYRDLDTYVITSADPADAKAAFDFVLHRKGPFSWKLARIDLPKTLPSKTPDQ